MTPGRASRLVLGAGIAECRLRHGRLDKEMSRLNVARLPRRFFRPVAAGLRPHRAHFDRAAARP